MVNIPVWFGTEAASLQPGNVEKCVASAIGSKLEQRHLTNMQNTHHSEFEWEHFCFALFGA